MQSDIGTETPSEGQEAPLPVPFYIKKQRWGTYVSYDAKTDHPLVTALEEEICSSLTHLYLKHLQEK